MTYKKAEQSGNNTGINDMYLLAAGFWRSVLTSDNLGLLGSYNGKSENNKNINREKPWETVRNCENIPSQHSFSPTLPTILRNNTSKLFKLKYLSQVET